MKITKTVLACLAVLAFFALTTRSARAGDVDCASIVACSFGSIVTTITVPVTNSTDVSSLTETVYLTSPGVYTYVFDVTNNSPSSSTVIDLAITNTLFPGNVDNFNCGVGGTCLNYGVVGLGTSSSVVDDTGFSFTASSLQVGINHLPNGGDQFTFYAQGPDPGPGVFSLVNGGVSGPVAVVGPLVEPSVLSQLGASLLLLLAVPFVVRMRRRMA